MKILYGHAAVMKSFFRDTTGNGKVEKNEETKSEDLN